MPRTSSGRSTTTCSFGRTAGTASSPQTNAGLAYGNDLFQGEQLVTSPFIRADIPRRLGWYGLPAVEHLFVDNAWGDIGRGLGVLRYMPEMVIEHLHPLAGKAEWDEGYERANNEDDHRPRPDRIRGLARWWRARGRPRSARSTRSRREDRLPRPAPFWTTACAIELWRVVPAPVGSRDAGRSDLRGPPRRGPVQPLGGDQQGFPARRCRRSRGTSRSSSTPTSSSRSPTSALPIDERGRTGKVTWAHRRWRNVAERHLKRLLADPDPIRAGPGRGTRHGPDRRRHEPDLMVLLRRHSARHIR
jgi:hypothetical protein